MLYIKEIYYRLVYLIIAFLVCLSTLYLYKDEIVFILILPSWLSIFPIKYFIFTEPQEIFFFYINIFLCISGLYLFPYGLDIFYEYFRPALYQTEALLYTHLKRYFLVVYLIANVFIFFIILPLFWNFFASFEKHSNLIFFYLELSAINYFKFLVSIFMGSNVLIIILLVLLKICLSKGIRFILNVKKYLILMFLIFSTVLTPPEIDVQILIFLVLWVLLELIMLVNLIILNYKIIIRRITN